MLRLFAALAFITLPLPHATAGQLFDDYLNHVRPGPGTGPGKARLTVTGARPVGQTFTCPADVGEVYRIGVRPVYDTWNQGERVTLTLFDSPAGTEKLGAYTIDEPTSRVQPYVMGSGSESGHVNDRVLYFQLRAPVKGGAKMLFQLSVEGGNASVEFEAFTNDTYAGGEATGAAGIADLSFECHVKPAPNREANLRRFFTERLDVSRPELSAVKDAVDAADWERAISETVKHFHNRMDLWQDWKDVMVVSPDPNADTAQADRLVAIAQGKPRPEGVNWRKESYWTPEPPGGEGVPNLYTWHIARTLAAAYTATGRSEYARAAIDLQMQWILDNPNPKVVFEKPPFPYYFQLWNDRTAAARTPGHGDLVYARLYNFDGWTDDEKLVFFSFIEDNARWTYGATSGANWGVEAAKACYEFGVKFPEWKMSPRYVSWGTSRLAELVLKDVRGDGVSTEAAIKYHAMVARRLLGMLEDHNEGRIKLEDDLVPRLTKAVEGMYEHMAYTLQPDGYVVMCGDSWYENYSALGFGKTCIKDPAALAMRIRESADPVSAFLRRSMPALAAEASTDDPEALAGSLMKNLNDIIQSGVLIYDPARFAEVKLRPNTARLLQQTQTADHLVRLNRRLLEDAYPGLLRKSYESSELYKAGEMLGRPDFVWIASQGEEGEHPKEVSKVFPHGGYFIMRSDFGPNGGYTDARHLFIHNGGWWGSHGHWDFTSVNLYAYGRTLIIDPGQYAYEPPEGIDRYWQSSIHSMMVLDDGDVKREPGPSEWVTNSVIDWFDGRHYGYSHRSGVEYVRRRVAFLRPGYFLVDDSAGTTRDALWTQVWNLTDPNARTDPRTKTIHTTFPDGGNVAIMSLDPGRLSVREAPGITAAEDNIPRTRILRLDQRTADPRFVSLVYPYSGHTAPKVEWERIPPDDPTLSNLFYSVRVTDHNGVDWAVFGKTGTPVGYRGGRHRADADFAAVRMHKSGGVAAFAWAHGRELGFNGAIYARCEQNTAGLAVRYDNGRVLVETKDPHPSLVVRVGTSSTVVLNGAQLTNPVIKDGMCHLFASSPVTIVADDRDAFETVTQTNEWTRVVDPGSYATGYTHHETDIGRHENGYYVFDVPQTRTYAVEVFLPSITMNPSDRVEYRIAAMGRPAAVGGAVVGAREEDGVWVLTVNQQEMSGWVRLGEFALTRGPLRINARNATDIDGLYFVADAMRLVETR